MKTPMQELIKHFKIRLSSLKEVRATAFDEMKRALDIQIEELELCILSAEATLEKERDVITKTYDVALFYALQFVEDWGILDSDVRSMSRDYYNETFKTK